MFSPVCCGASVYGQSGSPTTTIIKKSISEAEQLVNEARNDTQELGKNNDGSGLQMEKLLFELKQKLVELNKLEVDARVAKENAEAREKAATESIDANAKKLAEAEKLAKEQVSKAESATKKAVDDKEEMRKSLIGVCKEMIRINKLEPQTKYRDKLVDLMNTLAEQYKERAYDNEIVLTELVNQGEVPLEKLIEGKDENLDRDAVDTAQKIHHLIEVFKNESATYSGLADTLKLSHVDDGTHVAKVFAKYCEEVGGAKIDDNKWTFLGTKDKKLLRDPRVPSRILMSRQ